MMYVVLVDGMFVTTQSQHSMGEHGPVLDENPKYAKFFQTRNGAVACFNRVCKLWPERVVEIHNVNVRLAGLEKTNEN